MPEQPRPTTVQEDQTGPIRIVTLDRPERRNAIDLVLRIELAEALQRATTDAGVRAVVLTGAGGTFCSGGDLSTMRDVDREQARTRTAAAQLITRTIRSATIPVVAAVEGAAFGAGVALALACDRIVAADNARFSTAFTRVGLAGDMGITVTLPERVGTARARQMLMLPTEMSAGEALEAGLVDALTSPGETFDTALADAARLAAGPPLALAAIKRALNAGPRDVETALDREAAVQVELFGSDDLAEGAAAFAERRQPQFRGS